MKLSEKDIEKMMAFVLEHKEIIGSMLKVINESESVCDIEDKDDDEKVEIEISEGDAEKADTDTTSDGVDYPDVGDGTGVEGETLKENDDDEDYGSDSASGYDYDEEPVEDPEMDDDDYDDITETCGGGTASAPALGGAAVSTGGVGGTTANTGIARVKGRLGVDEDDKVTRRYDENAKCETVDDVEAMVESWKHKSGWQRLYN